MSVPGTERGPVRLEGSEKQSGRRGAVRKAR